MQTPTLFSRGRFRSFRRVMDPKSFLRGAGLQCGHGAVFSPNDRTALVRV